MLSLSFSSFSYFLPFLLFLLRLLFLPFLSFLPFLLFFVLFFFVFFLSSSSSSSFFFIEQKIEDEAFLRTPRPSTLGQENSYDHAAAVDVQRNLRAPVRDAELFILQHISRHDRVVPVQDEEVPRRGGGGTLPCE